MGPSIWNYTVGIFFPFFKKKNPFIIIYDFRYYWNYNTRAPCVVKCEMIRQVAAVFPSHFDSILENVEVSKIERKKKNMANRIFLSIGKPSLFIAMVSLVPFEVIMNFRFTTPTSCDNSCDAISNGDPHRFDLAKF